MSWGSPWAERRQGPPRVNLLPGEIHERRLVRRQRTGLGAAAVLLLALLGLWYSLQSRELTEARREADAERATTAGLHARKAQLQPYAVLEGQVAAAEQLKAKVYAQEIRFSGIMRDISAIMPDNVWLTKMTAALSDATGQAGASGSAAGGTSGAAASSGPESTATPGSPGAGSPVANVSFSGAGFGHVDVGTFLRALAAAPKKDGRPVYLNPYFTSSQKKGEEGDQATVTFSATVDLSPAVYSGRFQSPGQKGTVIP
jgi:hypothetical protein